MADTRLLDMTAATALLSTDIIYAVKDPAGTPLDRKSTVAVLAAAIGVHSGIYLPLTAVHDGTTADQAAINQSITDANAAGAGIVQLGIGAYAVNLISHPVIGSTAGVAIVPKENVWLRGAGKDMTIIKLKASQSVGGYSARIDMVLNYSYNTSTDDNIRISDLTFDGDGDNQTGLFNGVTMWNTDNFLMENVHIKRNRGTSASPPNERFALSMQNSSRFTIRHCDFEGGIVNSATGFAGNYSVDGTIFECRSWDWRIGHGFTQYACVGFKFIGCTADNIPAGAAYNNEYSFNFLYEGCQAGSRYPQATSKSSYADTTSAAVEKPVLTGFTFLTCGPGTVDSCPIECVTDIAYRINGDQSGIPTGITHTTGMIVVRNATATAAAAGATAFTSFVNDGHKHIIFRGAPQLFGGTWGTHYAGDTNYAGLTGPMAAAPYVNNSVNPGVIYSQEDSTARTPPVPAANTNFKNDFTFDVDVEFLTGTMTGTVIYISHTGTVQTGKDAQGFLVGAKYFLPKGQEIRLPWTGSTPTWRWHARY